MNEASWLGFGVSSTVTKTFMHFLPTSAGIGAPYPVDLRVTVGGNSLPRRTLSIDGARLGHPDGFRLEEAVPALSQQVSGIYMLQVELAPAQQRVDLSNSSILVEVQYQQAAVRYRPSRILNSGSESEFSLSKSKKNSASTQEQPQEVNQFKGFALRDPNLFASLVIINASPQAMTARIFSSRCPEAVGKVMIAVDTVKECDLVELGLSHSSKLDSTWGSVEVETFRVSFEVASSPAATHEIEHLIDTPNLNDGEKPSEVDLENQKNLATQVNEGELFLGAAVAAYVVYRDRSSRRISSVVAI